MLAIDKSEQDARTPLNVANNCGNRYQAFKTLPFEFGFYRLYIEIQGTINRISGDNGGLSWPRFCQ